MSTGILVCRIVKVCKILNLARFALSYMDKTILRLLLQTVNRNMYNEMSKSVFYPMTERRSSPYQNNFHWKLVRTFQKI